MILRDPASKVLSPDAAAEWRRSVAGPVVFTNGVFDLLHRGHIDTLVAARALGNALVVGVNDDASVRRLKGPARPVRTAVDRAHVLAALEAVDAVVIFSEDTPLELIRRVRPDILVKGGDYTLESIVGRADVERWGGRVVVIPLTPGHSTTSTIDRLHRDPSA